MAAALSAGALTGQWLDTVPPARTAPLGVVSGPGRWDRAAAGGQPTLPRAVLSHRSAAAIHRLPGVRIGLPELTVNRAHRAPLSGAKLYRSDSLTVTDIEVRRGVAVTTPVRTVCDLAAVVDAALVVAVLDEGVLGRRWTYDDVADALDRIARPGRPGTAILRRLLRSRVGDDSPDSYLEQRLVKALDPLRPFMVHHQLVLFGDLIVVDVAWPWAKVAAEIDGRHHRVTSRRAFDRDRHRMNLLAAADWKVAHLTSTMDDVTVLRAVERLLPGRRNRLTARS